MSAAAIDLSLVVPMFNEEDNLTALLADCLPALERVTARFEIVLVDDGSTDRTAEQARRAAVADPRIRALSLRRRFGKGAALAAGLARARGARVVTIDADLQEDPAQIGLLLAALDEGLDLVSGWRRHRADPLSKRISSRLFNALLRLVTGLELRDVNCGFKAMTRDVAGDLNLLGGRFRFIPLLAHWWGYRVGEREISHRPRRRGVSRFGNERFPGVLIDLLTMLCLIRFHSRPGHLFVAAGAVSGIAGFGICAYLTALFIQFGNVQHRHPLLALGVLLLIIGVQLVATGFLGEWLAYERRGQEPGYRVRWETGREE